MTDGKDELVKRLRDLALNSYLKAAESALKGLKEKLRELRK